MPITPLIQLITPLNQLMTGNALKELVRQGKISIGLLSGT